MPPAQSGLPSLSTEGAGEGTRLGEGIGVASAGGSPGVASREGLGSEFREMRARAAGGEKGGALALEGGVSSVGVVWAGLCPGSPVKKSVAGRGL